MKTENSSPPTFLNRPPVIKNSKALALLGVFAGGMAAQAATDYGPAIWRPCGCTKWNTSGNGHRFFVIHDMEGYYAYEVSTGGGLRRCGSGVSVHFAVNGKKDASSDYPAGEITQYVRTAYYAWHARCWNSYSLGTEHEGFKSNPAWFTEAMYVSSASCTKAMCTKYAIAKDRNHVIGHGQKSISAWRSWAAGQGYSSTWINCNTHSDPGSYWNWTHYMNLVKGTGSAPTAPSALKATVMSTSQINLAWTDNSTTETGFKVERKTGSGGAWGQIATVGANIKAYNNTGLASGTQYYYRVRSYNASGNSAYSNEANGTTKDTIPAAPTALAAAAASDTQINLTWAQAMPNEDGFRIYRSTDNVTFTLVATVGINVVAYNNTGLAGNTLYYYKVAAYNTAGNSAFSNTASDTTAPQAPSALAVNAVAGTTNWNKLALTWTDNAGSEVGFKIERGTAAAGPFTQIATNAAGVTAYTDSGLAATTTYYYRVRSYNANGNSSYSAVASRATPNAPPILTAIGNKTVLPGVNLAFTATASDPNAPAPATTTWQNFTSFPHNSQDDHVLFRSPDNSGTTSSFLDTSTNYTRVVTNGPSAWGAGNKSLVAGWGFKTGTANYWIRLNTFGTATNPNPAIALDQRVQFKLYSTKALRVGLGVRETGTTAAYGANGGTTGALEWVGVTNVVSSQPIPNKLVTATTAVTLNWNIPFEPQWSFTGDGKVDQSGAKGVLEHVILRGEGGTGAYSVFFDDMQVVVANNLVYSLDAGAPAGSTIGRRNGKFSWTPSAGLSGDFPVTVRVTDSLGGTDFETIIVSVLGSGNAAPVLNNIGNKTVGEGSALAFTATATEYNGGQTLTYTLDAGNPAGSSISSGGAFSWTPTEAQGPGSYPITVRVTDNGSPVSNDFETITVTVNEVNTAPVLASIANQTVTEGGTLNVTASATDSDVPANSITYSVAGPVGMSINSGSGAISYTPSASDGGQTYQVTVTATDNGVPVLKGTKTFNVTVTEVNTAPVLSIGAMNDVNPFAQFDELDDESTDGKNNDTLFRVPYFSATTTQFLDSSSFSFVTNDFPRNDVNPSYQALYVNMNFKTGTTNPWCRLTTHTSSAWTNLFAYPNPIVDLSQHVRFKIWTDRSIKVAIGIRETTSQNPLGFDGGVTGQIEWVGATASGGTPVPTRTIAASNWVQLDFNLPVETKAAFSGNGVLDGAKGVLEELAIVPNAGTGFYKIYVDDFEALIVKNTNNITIAKGDTLTLACSATDADLPAQDLSFSLTAAPTNAVISDSGVFSWKPEPDQAGTTNVVTLTVTDNGAPNLSSSQNITVVVDNINTPPKIAKISEILVENNSGATVTFDASAQDEDVPANTLTFSLISGPSGAAVSSSGTFTWTPPAGNSTNTATIRVTDNGSPALWDETTVTILVVPTNTAPVLSLGTARATEPVVTFETFTNATPNEAVMFKKPANSATTSAYVDTTPTNYTSVTTSFPAGNANAGAKVLRATWSFKTGTTNYWIRLNTLNTTFLKNTTINASARLKVDVYTTKALKVGLGIRETGTAAQNGADGGTTGAVEYVGCSSMIGSTPQPTRTVNAATWTTLEFDLPSEPCQTLTGNSVLAGGQQVLEHLVLVGAGGTGAYDVYLDNFQVVTTTALPGTVTMKASSTLAFTASATDPDPGAGLGYGLDADFTDTHTNAVLNGTNGVFSWTPGAGDVGTTNLIEVTVEDSPTNGGVSKSDTESLTVVVTADSLAPQDGSTFVAGGDSVNLTWDSVAGAAYAVQSKSAKGGDWSTVQTVTATGGSSSLAVSSGTDSYFRIVEAGSASE